MLQIPVRYPGDCISIKLYCSVFYASCEMAAKTTSLISISYDILTILVSIADVVTDIVVLIDFYSKDRMTFFGNSLGILILAHCGYAFTVSFRFAFEYWSGCLVFLCFCFMLPFGTLGAFCVYFANYQVFKSILRYMELDTNLWFEPDDSDSNFTKWLKTKLDKHLG